MPAPEIRVVFGYNAEATVLDSKNDTKFDQSASDMLIEELSTHVDIANGG